MCIHSLHYLVKNLHNGLAEPSRLAPASNLLVLIKIRVVIESQCTKAAQVLVSPDQGGMGEPIKCCSNQSF